MDARQLLLPTLRGGLSTWIAVPKGLVARWLVQPRIGRECMDTGKWPLTRKSQMWIRNVRTLPSDTQKSEDPFYI
jgi:hypothetical protein